MNAKTTPCRERVTQSLKPADSLASSTVTIAIFSLPKPFDDSHTACIQNNAISSWKALGDDVTVILLGDEPGIAEAAAVHGVRHSNCVSRNDQGTPLISDAFATAKNSTHAEVLVYCNADTILGPDFLEAINRVVEGMDGGAFLAMGKRTNLDVDHSIDFTDPKSWQLLQKQATHEGEPAAVVCKEYFAFSRDLFETIPDFAVGRGNWDNWMVASAKRNGVPVVDLSACVVAIHQNHDYRHLTPSVGPTAGAKNRRKHCYVSGQEARENQRLAGGKHIVSGSTTTHRLTQRGVVKEFFAVPQS